jgi:16S rRNA processing protein RimM
VERVVIAGILRARGNRGEVLAESLTDVPGRLQTLKRAHLQLSNGADISVEIEGAWKHKDYWVLKFANVDSITEAEGLRDADLWVPESERGELPEGDYFRSDLLGCTLRDEQTGADLGVVEGFQEYWERQLLLEVRIDDKERLVPFVPEICRRVDLGARVVWANLPEGLLQL